jgi:hypothetical protein
MGTNWLSEVVLAVSRGDVDKDENTRTFQQP